MEGDGSLGPGEAQAPFAGAFCVSQRAKCLSLQKGFGFIVNSSTGKDVFVHISAVEEAGLTSSTKASKLSSSSKRTVARRPR
jgi:cold shock CspA family protein